MFFETSQLLWKTKPKTPSCWNAGFASTNRRMKKNAMRTKIPAARAVSPHRRRSSASRVEERRPAAVIDAASIVLGRALRRRDRRAVALERADLRLRLAEDAARKRRVLQLRRELLAGTLRVLQPRLHALGLALAHAGLAEVLVDQQEGHGRDRVRLSARRVDRREAQVRRRARGLAGGRVRLEAVLHELAFLVLDGGRREVVLQRVGLLDVAHRAGVLLHAARDAVVALGARSGRPLDRLVDAGAVLPLGRVISQELGEVLGRARLVGA